MTRGDFTPVHRRLTELLADGEWHDGRTVLLEAGKTITPGVAQRMTEALRVRSSKNAPAERQKPMPLARQIESGKRKILTDHVRSKVKNQTWEMDPPWPLGHSLFDVDRPWRLRRLRGTVYLSTPEAAERLGVTAHVVRRIAQQKGLPFTKVGTTREQLRINTDDLPLYERAAKEYAAEAPVRQAQQLTRGANTRVENAIRKMLDAEFGPSSDNTVARVRHLMNEVTRLRARHAELYAEIRALRGDGSSQADASEPWVGDP